jgi:iron complex outermembrane receptor protein
VRAVLSNKVCGRARGRRPVRRYRRIGSLGYWLWAGLRFEHKHVHLEGEVKNVGEQKRVYGAETPTDGYTVVNFHGSYQIITCHAVHTVTVRADNVGDELYRNHLSYIKDLTPEMGHSFRLVYGVRF